MSPEYQRLFTEEVRNVLNEGARKTDEERNARTLRIARLTAEIERYLDAMGSLISDALNAKLEAAE